MRLYHFSDDPAIDTFIPRPVRMPSQRLPGMEWLNGPLVWAIQDNLDFLYHFPRDCPRILIWATARTSAADKAKWLGSYRAAAYIERKWLPDFTAATLHRYQLPSKGFEDLHDAGMWVSRAPVSPLNRITLADLPAALSLKTVDLRIVETLVPLQELWTTTLHTSGIRLRNATGWS
ncbi:DUF6886 family protein [uncultured Devosia sp.]|uniref:DUF6886 family protein n=1 Tax=uncultured Devosia sp. TaxID=211434 RepID=UPI0035CABAA7